MPNVPVDRTLPLRGVDRTTKDNGKLDPRTPRRMENFSLFDGYPERRKGFYPFSQKRIYGSQLTKHTPVRLSQEQRATAAGNTRFISPLSYGLIRAHTDFKPISTDDWTREFVLTLGEIETLLNNSVNDNYRERSTTSYNGATRTFRQSRGVYVYDQAILANRVDIKFAGGGAATTSYFDTFALVALSISYDTAGIYVESTLLDTATTPDSYEPDLVLLFYPFGAYVPGSSHHIAVRYDSLNRIIDLVIDGQEIDSYILPAGYVFAGEVDYINDTAYASGLQRDIVILNEFTARASYASSCKLDNAAATRHGYQTYRSDNLGSSYSPFPWAKSPPRGTGINELRIWNVRRSTTEINDNLNRQLNGNEDGLVGYWPCTDGGPVCLDQTTNKRHMTIHAGPPAFVAESGFIHGYGLLLADGQCINYKFPDNARDYILDSALYLSSAFGHNSDPAGGMYTPNQQWAVQMQIKTPHKFQEELNKFAGSGTITGTVSDTRDIPNAPGFRLFDGFNGTLRAVADETGAVSARYHRAYDTTLFCIDGYLEQPGTAANHALNREHGKVVVARGLLTPEGKIAVEFFGEGSGANLNPREYRLVSNTALNPNTVYIITVVKVLTGAATVAIRVYIGTSGSFDRQLVISAALSATASGGSIRTAAISNITIGASYYDDSLDRSIQNLVSAGYTYRATPKRHLSPYQDQPGFFTLGYFRLWTGSVALNELFSYAGQPIGESSTSPGLIVNLEMDSITGTKIPNKTRYSLAFDLGYKGWGTPQPNSLNTYSAYPGAWSMDDRLGYSSLSNNYTHRRGATCYGLGLYRSVLRKALAFSSIYDAGAYIGSRSGSAPENPLYMDSHGLLNDFIPGRRWNIDSAGDRSIYTSEGGIPKVYNGKTFTPLGFKKWGGGNPVAASNAGGSITGGWYALRLAYVSEEYSILDVSDPIPFYIDPGGNRTVTIANISPHPDPRVTAIWLCFTDSQLSRDLAVYSQAFKPLASGPIRNEFFDIFTYVSDAELARSSTVIPINFTPAPEGAYSAVMNERLFIAGDPLVPDRVFFSDAGNLERFDIVENYIIVPSGDAIVGLISDGSTLYILKHRSIWIAREIQSGVFDVVKVTDVGPVSQQAAIRAIIPDTGTSIICMWTYFGPYVYDTVRMQSIGFPIQQNDYSYIDHKDVFIAHDVVRSEVLFYYKSTVDGVKSSVYDKALVYNYRHIRGVTGGEGGFTYNYGIWNDEYTSVLGSAAGSFVTVFKDSPATDINIDKFSPERVTLIGGDNGMTYKYGLSNLDGLLDGSTHHYPTISYSPGVINTATVLPSGSYNGLWVTIRKQDNSSWQSVPIIYNTENTIVIDTEYPGFVDNIESGDLLSIGNPPAYVEYPWDALDGGYINKQIHELIIWTQSVFYYKLHKNWTTENEDTYRKISDFLGSERKKVQLSSKGKCEVAKLKLVCFEDICNLSGYVYTVAGQPKVV